MALTIHGANSRGAEGLTTIMNTHQTEMNKSIERVSTGLKINRSGDDAAGKAISDRMLAQIRALDQGQENTQTANSLLKVADAAITSIVDIVRTMHTKALEATDDTFNANDREALMTELKQLKDQVTSSALVTQNGRYLLTGDFGELDEAIVYSDWGTPETTLNFSRMSWNGDDPDRRLNFQVGPEKDSVISAHLMDFTEKRLFRDVTIDVSNSANASKTAESLERALTRALYQQAEIGSVQERLEFTSENLQMVSNDTTEALSTIQDADLAKEMTNYVKNNLLMQATQSMMAQANTSLATFIDLIKESRIS